VILIRRLYVDAGAPGSITQTRSISFAILDKAFESVPHETRHEAIPFRALKGVRIYIPAVYGVTGASDHFAEIIPSTSRQQTL
jgi:hypothetical protein